MVCMRALRGFAALCLVFAACATGASNTGDTTDDDSTAPDAHTGGPPDAHTGAPDAMEQGTPDANVGPTPRTLTQSNSTSITDQHTIACSVSDTTTGLVQYTRENRFYRVFDLPALGITTTYTATRVDFGVETAQSTTGSLTVQVKLHTLNQAPGASSFPLSALNQLYGQNVTITAGTALNTQQVTLSSPVVVPAGSRLVVEIFSPDMSGPGNGNYFYPGSNPSGETGPSYIAATDCGFADPTRFSALGLSPDPLVDLVIQVQGTTP
jgi:hypothetical protein